MFEKLRSTLFVCGFAALAAPQAAEARCGGGEPILGELTCSSTYTGSMTDTSGTLEDYDCGSPYSPLTQAGPEDVYEFTCQNTGTVTMDITGLACDFDIYILDSTCDPKGGCEEGSTEPGTKNDSISFSCTKGQTYYIVIEGYGFTDSSRGGGCKDGDDYTLSFDVSASTGCNEDCNNGVDDDLDGDIDCDDSDCIDDPVCGCDADGDGYSATTCGGTDCNDADRTIHPGATEACNGIDDDCDGTIDDGATTTYYADSDGDGYGGTSTTTGCTAPTGYTTVTGDCNDADGAIHPGAAEVCNGKDDDCDGRTDEGLATTTYYRDGDGDSYGDPASSTASCSPLSGYVTNRTDCDDTDGAVHPGATEVCNGIDDDCDTSIDEGVTTTYYRDADGDSYGDPATTRADCSRPTGYVTNSTDCDDTDRNVHPGATEACNGIDDDCDTLVDEGVKTTYYADTDGDGYGRSGSTVQDCSTPTGYADVSGDCDDTRDTVYPTAPELCDGLDNDCDSAIDEGVESTFYRDADGDKYGDPSLTTTDCTAPSGYVADSTDCDDKDGTTYPGAPEICDGLDNDCDGDIDEGASGTATWYLDADSDGYGDKGTSTSSCSRPDGYVNNSLDCDDSDDLVNPSASEKCNGIDDDCDGTTDEADAIDATTWYADDDSDTYGDLADTKKGCTAPSGYVASSTDCDDTDAAIHPGATELCNGADDDCDGTVDENDAADADTWYADTDGDKYGDVAAISKACDAPTGYVADATDCDDDDPAVNPAATEVCNGIDDDCDTVIDTDAVDRDTYYADADSDGYGDASSTTAACSRPTGYTADSTDCDDTNGAVNPAATEIPYDGIDNDCDGSDLTDVDGDGYPWEGVGGTDCADNDATVYPGAPESADGVDEDCDDVVDEGTDHYDDDGDGYTELGGDCDDADVDASPKGVEDCDTVDDDCDGVVDEDTECSDDDGDGFSEDDGDCNDGDAAVGPSETEIDGNGVDDDCDGSVDDGVFDPDGDGYTEAAGDCDNEDPDTYPGASEIEDGVDNDCDKIVDEGTAAYDDDGDGLSENDGDCDDTNADVGVDGTEDPSNGIDDDCDGTVDEGGPHTDDDGDGFTEEGGDCDDADEAVNPGADEAANGSDDDCDGEVDEGSSDVDGDGYTVEDGDCNDRDGWQNPGTGELCDGVDNNCNGSVDEGVADCLEDTGSAIERGKCGCSTPASPAIWLPWAFALIGLRRRTSR